MLTSKIFKSSTETNFSFICHRVPLSGSFPAGTINDSLPTFLRLNGVNKAPSVAVTVEVVEDIS